MDKGRCCNAGERLRLRARLCSALGRTRRCKASRRTRRRGSGAGRSTERRLLLSLRRVGEGEAFKRPPSTDPQERPRTARSFWKRRLVLLSQ